jgi:hypothetical protein
MTYQASGKNDAKYRLSQGLRLIESADSAYAKAARAPRRGGNRSMR